MEGTSQINSNQTTKGAGVRKNPEENEQAISNSTNDTAFSFGVVKESESGFKDISEITNVELIKQAE